MNLVRTKTTKSKSDPTYSEQWSGVSGAPICRKSPCPRCNHFTHHEAGSHYCPQCDDYVRKEGDSCEYN